MMNFQQDPLCKEISALYTLLKADFQNKLICKRILERLISSLLMLIPAWVLSISQNKKKKILGFGCVFLSTVYVREAWSQCEVKKARSLGGKV